MFVRRYRCWLWVFPRQKPPRLFFFSPLLRTFRIQSLHAADFIVGKLRQPSNEMHEAPARVLAFGRAGPPCGHAGQSDAILDDREQLTIRELLGRCRSHVGSAWIQTKPDRRGTAAVVGVAHGTMIGEVLQAFGEHGLGWCHRIRHRPHLTRRCETPHGASHEYLDPRWLRTRTETATSDRIGQDSS